jgi:hypothetical protein
MEFVEFIYTQQSVRHRHIKRSLYKIKSYVFFVALITTFTVDWKCFDVHRSVVSSKDFHFFARENHGMSLIDGKINERTETLK